MAFCDDLNAGISSFCGTNIGGVSVAYIADFSKVSSLTISTQSVVTAISMTASGIFYKFNFREDTSSFTQDNPQTNSADLVTQVGTLVFPQLSTTNRNVFELLRGKKLGVVYKDFNEKYWYSGYKYGVRMTGRNQTTGTARTDENLYTLTLTAVEPSDMYEVSSAVIVAPNFQA